MFGCPPPRWKSLEKKIPVTSNRSPSGWDVPNQDLLLNDPESTLQISTRFVLADFARVMLSITKDDVLDRHEESYEESNL